MMNTTFDTRGAGPKALSDDELRAETRYWRNRLSAEGIHAAGGVSQFAQVVRKFECELSARFGGTTTIAADLEPAPIARSWWKRS